jgi:cyclohexadieny/prephenate dehydrogenase
MDIKQYLLLFHYFSILPFYYSLFTNLTFTIKLPNTMRNKKYLFNRIAIIGLGLIGSSLARIVKKKNIAKHICAYNKNGDVLKKALALDIIDTAALNLHEAVIDADLVILCTPIGTYQYIIKQISPYLADNAIITDVGSVKNIVLSHIGDELSEQHLPTFIPAHPIAGSEKSGLDAGSAELFKGRQTILTPTDISDTVAIGKVKKFWEACGSSVELMNPAAHDEIYATASHLPHLISFCFVTAIGKQDAQTIDEIKNNADDEFMGFIRLAGSNADMWTDICLYNKTAINANIRQFYNEKTLPLINTAHDAENLFNRLLEAKIRRHELDDAYKSCTSNPSGKSYVFMKILPKIIAGITIESVRNTDHVGGGFLGLTENILNIRDKFIDAVIGRKEFTNNAINALLDEVEVLQKLIDKSDKDGIGEYIAHAGLVYQRLVL